MDFVNEEGGPPGFAESSSSTIDVPSGTVVVQADLTIGEGPGPREPDFVDQFGGGLCSAVEIGVVPAGVATAQMDWKTGASKAMMPGAVPTSRLTCSPHGLLRSRASSSRPVPGRHPTGACDWSVSSGRGRPSFDGVVDPWTSPKPPWWESGAPIGQAGR